MADTLPITSSLFGISPESLQAQRQAVQEAQAMRFAQLDPAERATYGFYRAGQQTGNALAGLMGAQDPELEAVKLVQSLGAQYDKTTPEGLGQLAQALQATGNPYAQQFAVQAAQRATQMAQQLATTRKATAEATKVEQGNIREEQLRTALSQLPPDATDQQVQDTVRQFGNPDQIFKAIETRTQREADRAAKAQIEREKIQAREDQQKRDLEFRQMMAQLTAEQRAATTSLQRELIQARIDALNDKRQEKIDKKETAQQAAITHANNVINDVQAASTLVDNTTTGLIGKASSLVPQTAAYDLNNRLATIKANLGFDRLQQMRDASPTGGALGQVAVQELQALQSTVGSLEIGQSRTELARNLNKIEHHYNNWLRTTKGEKPLTLDEFNKMKNPQAAPKTAGAGGWSIRPVTPNQ